MSQGMSINTDLLTQSLNFHGSELTSLIRNCNAFKKLDPKRLDYQTYTKRSKDLIDGRSQRTSLQQFIESKLDLLFDRQNLTLTDHNAIINKNYPLLDMWMGESTSDFRTENYFKKLQVGDVLFCSPLSPTHNGVIMEVLVHLSAGSKINYTGDLNLKVMMPKNEAYRDVSANQGVVYKLCVIDGVDTVRPTVGMKWSSVPREARQLEEANELGLVSDKDLPIGLKNLLRNQTSETFKDLIEHNDNFRSPTGIQEMAEDLGISLKAGAWSLFDGLSQGSYSPTVTSDGIEQAQNNLMAKQHYSKGIDYYEKNDAYAAHYCFSQAIKFNPNHVESLFGRGSLYANDSKYSKSFEDLKAALRLDPDHKNCLDYTLKVLKIIAAGLLKTDKIDEALKVCESVLEIVPENQKVLAMKKELLSYLDSSSSSQYSDDDLQRTEKKASFENGLDKYKLDQPTASGNPDTSKPVKPYKEAPIPSASEPKPVTSAPSFVPIPPVGHYMYGAPGFKGQVPGGMPVPRVESDHERLCREFLEKTNSRAQGPQRYSKNFDSISPRRPSRGVSITRDFPEPYSNRERYIDERDRRRSPSASSDHKGKRRSLRSRSHERGSYQEHQEDDRVKSYRDREKYKNNDKSKREERSKSVESKTRNTSREKLQDRKEKSRSCESPKKGGQSSRRRNSSKEFRRSRTKSSTCDNREKKSSKSVKIEKSQKDLIWVEKDQNKKSKKKKSKKKSYASSSSDEYHKSSSSRKRRRNSSEVSKPTSARKRHGSESSEDDDVRHHQKRKGYHNKKSDKSSDESDKSPSKKLRAWEKSTQDLRWMTKTYSDSQESSHAKKSKNLQEFSRSFSPNALKAFNQESDDEEDESKTVQTRDKGEKRPYLPNYRRH